ncbi:LOW QUALITY PROTEIN: cotranscriptional regulator FAM172A-like [Gigantopelta aegis]|uniref:LOW QUALITY PROTEIN: cotranscriptional regulator FAM172A-like n=1 Tax=Gigantopelta aegis TaxID=1735272 RepID=UPI001B8874CE|nr:LOW QUALITY PROTEIN: cotranscriptional regulator FAM172A-like [Gigantopelta aegis]
MEGSQGQRLLNIETDEPFIFEVEKGNREFNQKHYEALGEVITEEVYNLLESETHLKRHIIPVRLVIIINVTIFFLASEDAFTNPVKLMIIIHGSGVVRAGNGLEGKLIMNDCLDSGTQLPFIKRAMREGYGVVVLMETENHIETKGKKINIRGSSTPERHGQYVWRHFISKSQAKRIDIVAHSYGGVVVMETVVVDDRKKWGGAVG